MSISPTARERYTRGFREIRRWLAPGLGIKRWFFLAMAGITLISVGLAILLLNLYRTDSTSPAMLEVLSFISLRFLPRFIRAAIFGGLGVWLAVYGVVRLNRSLLQPFVRADHTIVDELTNFRRLERGPRIVTIGGGHGLATLLRGLKIYSRNLTAVVTVADDGGSSGRLRESFGILPPGDIRNCLAALSNDERMITQLFQYRFSSTSELEGHSFGNLFITALADITGSFEGAIAESGKVLSVNGRVLPATLHNVKLVADMQLPNSLNQVRVEGESRIPKMSGRVHRIWLEPNDAPAYPPVIKAILNAEMIVIGPGSLFTSLLPNLLVQDLLGAIHASRAFKIYICNIVTQAGETDAFTCHDHIRVIEEHVGNNLFDVLLCNDNFSEPLNEHDQWVVIDDKTRSDERTQYADLINESHPWRHDSVKLANALIAIMDERTRQVE